MAKYGKYRSTNEVFDAFHGVPILINIEGVIENMQMLRKDLKKPPDEQLGDYSFDRHLRDDIGALNRVVKQLKRNKKKN